MSIRFFLVTASVLLAVFAAGLFFAWGFGVFDDPTWQIHAGGWLGLAFAAFAASCHPATDWLDDRLPRLKGGKR